MTDTPGWTSPGSSEPSSNDVRPAADTVPGPVGDAPGGPGPYDGGYGGAYGSIPGQSQGPGGNAGWGAPGAPGGAPQGGWGHTGWGVPLSPKPGVVPLRPLGVGEVLDGAVTTVRKHWRTALGLSLGLAALQQLLETLGQWLAYERPGTTFEVISMLAPLPLTLLLGVIAVGMLTMVVSKAVLGQHVTVAEAWRAARPRLLALTGLTFLTTLILVVPFLPGIGLMAAAALNGPNEGMLAVGAVLAFAALPVTLWLAVSLSLAAPALVLERQGVLASLARSRRLARNSWWRLFGVNALTQIVTFIASNIALAPFEIIAFVVSGDFGGDTGSPFDISLPPAGLIVLAIGGTLVATFTIPLGAAVNVLLYIDQRIRREALDIELARAAGLPEYGSTGWSDRPPTPPGV